MRDSVILRQLTVDDALAYAAAVDASRAHLSQYGDKTAAKYPHVGAVVESIVNPPNPHKLRMGIWDDGTFVGAVNLTPGEDEAEVGYWLDVRHTGKGYATLAATAMAGYARAQYSRVYAKAVEGNEASARVLARSGFRQTAREAGKLIFELATVEQEPVLFPHLAGKEQAVAPGDYQILEGDSKPVQFEPERLVPCSKGGQRGRDLLPGVHLRGWHGAEYPVVSFLYHKLGPDGELETTERAIILTGISYGEHPGHAGQPPTWYLVGAQIGTFDHETGEPVTLPKGPTQIAPKHFSIACITDGPWGEAMLANPL